MSAIKSFASGRQAPKLFTLNPQSQTPTLKTGALTLNPQPYTLNPTPSTLHPEPYTLNPRPYTLNPQPYTLNPEQAGSQLADLLLSDAQT